MKIKAFLLALIVAISFTLDAKTKEKEQPNEKAKGDTIISSGLD